MERRMQMRDQFDRQFRTLRVSLTNLCNLACVYCVPENSEVTGKFQQGSPNKSQNTLEILDTVQRLHRMLNLKVVRLTGGEPLLFRGVIELISSLTRIGIPEIKITTNAFLLEDKAIELKNAGITSINISLDTIKPEIFRKISKTGNLDKIIRGIDKACSLKIPIKINAVIMKGINEHEILPLLEFARSRKISIRFLELMKMGHLNHTDSDLFFSEASILKVISAAYEIKSLQRLGSATARLWQTGDGYIFGIIANESSPFCKDCDRLRIDSTGNMYGCLSSNIPIPLFQDEDNGIWLEKLQKAMSHKQMLRFTGSELSMLEIGG